LSSSLLAAGGAAAASKPKVVRKARKSGDQPALLAGVLDGAVPPINVLLVEDNIINLKLLEAFMKRLKVRWQTAMNGRDAVSKWRAGGFHLVLMDIQLPVMNGLDATREIRRLERVNSIGVFSSSPAPSPSPSAGGTTDADGASDGGDGGGKTSSNDRLENVELFKSPVIIVALTASSLQSDRHEALAAGCNDFLTKVGFFFFTFSLTSRRSSFFFPPSSFPFFPYSSFYDFLLCPSLLFFFPVPILVYSCFLLFPTPTIAVLLPLSPSSHFPLTSFPFSLLLLPISAKS
jgi:CheY-like chemotaxis protein